jgi:hypothetical protein
MMTTALIKYALLNILYSNFVRSSNNILIKNILVASNASFFIDSHSLFIILPLVNHIISLYNDKNNISQGGSIMVIRRFENADAQQTFEMIAHTLRTVNIKDYSPQYIEDTVAQLMPDILIERRANSHMYVICDGEKIIPRI